MASYCVLIALIAHSFDIPLLLIALGLVFNVVVLYLFGSYVLRAVIFPYANYFIKKKLDSTINEKFAKEFNKLLDQMLDNVKIMAKMSNDKNSNKDK